ncbi:MAG: radical SAM protein [Candidatus Helarchaeota archaeon]|nr:radical SAM protein [Candidatus Helarchaeota archaeon]
MKELNLIRKDFRKVELKIALCYPNLYQAGIACHAIQLLYFLFNSFENIQCERFYYNSKTHPISMESGQPLKKFDIVCFSLQYELDYINVLKMISSGGIPPLSERRATPLVIAGGPCALENPLPLFPFIDFFVLGDLEPVLDQLISYLMEYKKGNKTLHDFQDIPGVFVPLTHRGEKISKSVAPDLDKCFHPSSQLISEASPFGRSLLLEVTRGCPRGCRFCLIGYQALPMRSRSLATLKQIILDGVERSHVKKVSLIGPSLSDYPRLKKLCEFIVEQGLQLSLPSMRVEALTDSLLEILYDAGVRTISIAPEAGSARLRATIGKELSTDLFSNTLIKCSEAKIENLKIYFIINLPTETAQDIEEISTFLGTVIHKIYPPQHLNLSINPFIPKPHTPFQWEPPIDLPVLQKSIKTLEKSVRKLKIYNYDFLDPRWARIQGFLSRGDEKVGEILLKVMEAGGTLGAWRKVVKMLGVSIEESQSFPPTLDEPLPWDFIDVNVDKKKLIDLYQRTYV